MYCVKEREDFNIGTAVKDWTLRTLREQVSQASRKYNRTENLKTRGHHCYCRKQVTTAIVIESVNKMAYDRKETREREWHRQDDKCEDRLKIEKAESKQ